MLRLRVSSKRIWQACHRPEPVPLGGAGIAFSAGMKRADFKVLPGKGGWIRTTLAPINEKHSSSFGVADVVMLSALVLGVIAVARLFIAH